MKCDPIAVSAHSALSELDYASAAHTGFDSLATDQTITGQKTFTKVPVGTGVGDGPVYINPASSPANGTLLGVALAGAQKFRVDEDGDVNCGRIDASLIIAASGLTCYADLRVDHAVTFRQEAVAKLVSMGLGNYSQIALGGNLDQDDVLIKRDVDGGGSWAEAGALQVWQRDITNVTAENGHFWEAQNAAGAILSMLDKDGSGTFGELTVAGQGYVHIKGDDDSDDDPGCLVLYNHAGTPYWLWVDQTGDLRIHTAAPADEDADGVVVGTQA